MSIMTKLYITLLGEFTISYEDKIISERSRRSPKMWTLLEYLIIFKNREISQNELIKLLWGDEAGKNPVGALKTQLHRLRTELSKLGLKENIIINTHGSYAFNKALNYSIDAEEFEELSRLAIKETDIDLRLNLILKAAELYKNDFLPKLSAEVWINPFSTYYRSLYLRIVQDGVELLKAANKPHEIITLCERAVLIKPYDEYLHSVLIETLVKIGNKQGAKTHYNYVLNLFKIKFGIEPSGELISTYNKVIGAAESKTSSFPEVINGLSESKKDFGAFYCEYELFKHIYHLESRYMERHNRNISLFLLTLNDITEAADFSGKMENLGNAIKDSLRMSDVFARYSICQYIILLHDALEFNYTSIIERIKKKYINEYPMEQDKLKSEIQLLEISSNENVINVF